VVTTAANAVNTVGGSKNRAKQLHKSSQVSWSVSEKANRVMTLDGKEEEKRRNERPHAIAMMH